ncbi:MAG: glycerol-3-phosphate dehydrogenase [Arenicella sp.]|jgi:glycerol-3-phosphate dehydrogenase
MKNIDLLSAANRSALLGNLKSDTFDLLVIGGGITGAGIALDAASRGMKVALVEKLDFASGTSSKSTKLIHGGLRYLKQFEIALVREVGSERAVVHTLAPHLVTSEKMLLPLIKNGTYGSILTSFGLMVYDVLAGVESADQRVMLDKKQTMKAEPLLDASRVEGGGLYAEYRTDDARLTIEVIKTSSFYGANCANYVQAENFIYEGEGESKKIIGAVCRDELMEESFEIKSKFVVSAAGPWVDELRGINKSKEGKRLHLTKGVHVVVPHEKLPVKQAVYFDVPDGRMIFAIPRQKVTYIGTTDTDYTGDKDKVLANEGDVRYLLNGANQMFPEIDLQLEDVVSTWAGLRPLIHEDGKSASELSRKDEIFVSPTNLISIAGGKLTGYRKMAERIVDLVDKQYRKQFGGDKRKSRTAKIPLANGGLSNSKDVKTYRKQLYERLQNTDLKKREIKYLVSNYGRQTDIIITKFLGIDGDSASEMMLKAELWYCINHEAVFTAMDFFNRRTGRLYFQIETIEPNLEIVLKEMSSFFDWSETKLSEERESMELAISETSKIFRNN